jgi:hypothetical protein
MTLIISFDNTLLTYVTDSNLLNKIDNIECVRTPHSAFMKAEQKMNQI